MANSFRGGAHFKREEIIGNKQQYMTDANYKQVTFVRAKVRLTNQLYDRRLVNKNFLENAHGLPQAQKDL